MKPTTKLRIRQICIAYLLFWIGTAIWRTSQWALDHGDPESMFWFWSSLIAFGLIILNNALSDSPTVPWLTPEAVKKAFKK